MKSKMKKKKSKVWFFLKFLPFLSIFFVFTAVVLINKNYKIAGYCTAVYSVPIFLFYFLYLCKKLHITIMFIVFTGILYCVFYYIPNWWYSNYVTQDLQNKVRIRFESLSRVKSTMLYDRMSEVLGAYSSIKSDWIYDPKKNKLMQWRISKAIMLAEGSIENPKWYWLFHPKGRTLKCAPWSYKGFIRAAITYVITGRKTGGSNPVLQAAKNYTSFAREKIKGRSKLWMKLFYEMPIAYSLCQQYSPNQVMALYLATVHSGYKDYYGVHRTALYLFGTPFIAGNDLTWEQALVIASGLPNPSKLNPWYLKSCLLEGCDSDKKYKFYIDWKQRIKQHREKIEKKYKVILSKKLPAFKNTLREARAISSKFSAHDQHLRKWIQKEMDFLSELWDKAGYIINLLYDKRLTLGNNIGKKGLQGIIKEHLKIYRAMIQDMQNKLQISYCLIDAKRGEIISQYGGELSLDLSMAKKPVVGSLFKTITSFVLAKYWPDDVPVLNYGEPLPYEQKRKNCAEKPEICKQRHLFTYMGKKHWLKNDSTKPFFLDKPSALALSANIGFVFASLYYTWFITDLDEWNKLFETAFISMYKEKNSIANEAIKIFIHKDKFIEDAEKVRQWLIKNMGYGKFLHQDRILQYASFEAAKARTVQMIIKYRKNELLIKNFPANAVAELLAKTKEDTLDKLNANVLIIFKQQLEYFKNKFKGEITWEQLAWVPELRMEVGLRYIMHIGKTLSNFSVKNGNLQPVMTMTLGVSNWSTRELANLAASITADKAVFPFIVEEVKEKDRTVFSNKQKVFKELTISSVKVKTYMSAVLQSVKIKNEKTHFGTAYKAGAFIQKKYGKDILKISGAKTGTVQGSKGVSCIGYIGNRAGALTVSTPRNKILCKKICVTRKRNKCIKTKYRCINSSSACLLLFKLLSYWKDNDEDATDLKIVNKKNAQNAKNTNAHKKHEKYKKIPDNEYLNNL